MEKPKLELPSLLQKMKARTQKLGDDLAQACARASRSVSDVQVLVVSKHQSLENIRIAHQLGFRLFGENYLDEALQKQEALSDLPDLQWEMIGHVQSRKAKQVVNAFTRVQSVDSLKLALLLSRFRGPELGTLELLLQMNVSGEESKNGFIAHDEKRWPELLSALAQMEHLPGIKVCGLMTMPPLNTNPGLTRPYFARLRRLSEYIRDAFPGFCGKELSMGTSVDFGVAIEEGATMIRLGEAIFGSRKE